jgi:hypothetical protein
MKMKKIKEYIEVHSKDWQGTLSIITSWVVQHITDKTDKVLFQTNFGFMNDDVPCTILIKLNKTGDYNLSIASADWSMFNIDDESYNHVGEFCKICTTADKSTVPNWEDENNMFSIAEAIWHNGYMHYDVFNIRKDDIFNKLLEYFKEEYSETQDFTEIYYDGIYDAIMVLVDEEEGE